MGGYIGGWVEGNEKRWQTATRTAQSDLRSQVSLKVAAKDNFCRTTIQDFSQPVTHKQYTHTHMEHRTSPALMDCWQ